MKMQFFLKIFCLNILLLVTSVVFADTNSIPAIGQEVQVANLQLNLEKQRLQLMQYDLTALNQNQKETWQSYIDKGVTQGNLDHAAFSVANAQAMIGNIKISLADASEAVTITQNELSNLRKNNGGDGNTGSLQSVQLYAQKHQSLQNLLDVQNQRIDVLNQSLDVSQLRIERLRQVFYQLQRLRQSQIQTQQQLVFARQESQLQQQQSDLLEKLLKLNQEFNHISTTNQDRDKATLQFQIFKVQEQISINRLQLFLTELSSDTQSLLLSVPDAHNGVAALYSSDDQAAKLQNQLNDMGGTVEEKIQLLRLHKKLLNENQDPTAILMLKVENQNDLENIINSYLSQLKEIHLLQKQVSTYRNQVSQVLKHQFTIRQTLPGWNFTGWLNLLNETMQLPVVIWHYTQNTAAQFWFQLRVMSEVRDYFLTLFGVLLLASWIFLRRSFIRLLDVLEESSRRFSSQVLGVILTLIKRNLGIILIFATLVGLSVTFEMELGLWISMVMVVMVYRFIITLVRLWLIESTKDAHGRDVKLYKRLRWVFNFAMVLTIFTYAAHMLPVAYEVKELFNRLFMLLSLVLSLLLLSAWSVLPTLIQSVFAVRKKYIVRAIRLICWVLPVALLTNAIIGLIGFVNFAWAIAKYQAITILVLSVYMVIRGIIADFMQLNYELLIRHFKSGWMWGQAFVRPIDRILRVTLFLVMCFFLMHYFGLDKNQAFLLKVHKLATDDLFVFAGNPINLKFIIGLCIFSMVLYWCGKWSREFAFRWMYKRAKDIGVRNSLSIFTQYLIVIVGVIIGLRILGVDFRAFAVAAAAFAVALAYGVRDQASNFFSGILLLIERPFRTGDTITMGDYEGEVVETGMRSVKIRTHDHMDVMIPYSQMFANAFVNWTHQDPIVRTVIEIKVAREDDPHRVKDLIFSVLKSLPAVLEHPEPRVYMREINHSLLEFEVRYFVNLQVVRSRDKVRSEVLFAIWDCFKQHNIQAPHPHYQLHVNHKNAHDFIEENVEVEIR